jgi:hypothetical protein
MPQIRMMIAIHQPQFMPWLGYFDKMDRCDIFVLLDNVQFKKNEYQNRNKIKTSQGWEWFTIPVKYRYPQKINEVMIENSFNWRKKHLHALETNYGKSPYFERYIDRFNRFYQQEWQSLSQVNIASVRLLKELIGIDTKMIIASEMEGLSDEPNQRLIDICKRLGSDTYLAGSQGKEYMEIDSFNEAHIHIVFQEFKHPVYSQLFGKFEYFMSAIDLVFNSGNESLEIIRRENR